MLNLSVVIPSHNNAQTILDTIGSVSGQLPDNGELIVIDDCSSDESLRLVRSRFPSARVYENHEKLGAAATRNKGLEQSEGIWVLLVDADVTLNKGCLGQLLEASMRADIVFPKILYPNGQIMYPTQKSHEEFLLISTVFLLRRRALEALPGPPFDETYGTYCEDTDFFLRLYMAGLTSVYVENAIAVHNNAKHTGDRESRYELEVRNAIYGGIKFLGIRGIGRFDHAFRLTNIGKVILAGLFNFDLFDMQARGYQKNAGNLQKIRLLIGEHDTLTKRSRAVLLSMVLRGFLWNVRHLPLTLCKRKQLGSRSRAPLGR